LAKQKKRFLWIILSILLLVAGFAYYQYQKITAVKNLEIKLDNANLEKATLAGIQLGFTIEIHNPNKIDVNIGAFRARIYANEVPLTEINLPETKLPALQSIQKTVSLKLSYLEVGTAIIRAIQQKDVIWKVQGEYILKLPFGITYPYMFEIVR